MLFLRLLAAVPRVAYGKNYCAAISLDCYPVLAVHPQRIKFAWLRLVGWSRGENFDIESGAAIC